jgi:hypothetical protein
MKSKTNRWAVRVTFMTTLRNAHSIFVGEPEGKRQLRRPRHRWGGKIRMDLRDVGWKGVDWIHLAQDRDQ